MLTVRSWYAPLLGLLLACTSGSAPAHAPETASSPPAEEPEAAGSGAESVDEQISTGSLRLASTQAGLSWPPGDVSIVVEKAARRLTVFSGDRALVQWRVGLGGPEAPKIRQGDRATPEGTFKVVTRNDRSRFHLFLGISYPELPDAERGLSSGLISEAQARAIREAAAAGRVPPWNTRLGGEIGIHGGGGGTDWTLGCVAVENPQIEELWEAVPLGTTVRIEP